MPLSFFVARGLILYTLEGLGRLGVWVWMLWDFVDDLPWVWAWIGCLVVGLWMGSLLGWLITFTLRGGFCFRL